MNIEESQPIDSPLFFPQIDTCLFLSEINLSDRNPFHLNKTSLLEAQT